MSQQITEANLDLPQMEFDLLNNKLVESDADIKIQQAPAANINGKKKNAVDTSLKVATGK